MTFIRFGAAIVLATAASMAAAQGASSPSSPAKKELIAKILQQQQSAIETIGNQLALQTSQQILGGAAQALERLPADRREAVGKEIQAEVRKFYEEVSPTLRSTAFKLAPATLGVSMEERFTEDELRTVLAWLESSASKKFQQASAELVPVLAQKLVAETRGTVEPKMQALQASLSKKLGLPPAGAASAPAAAPAAPPAARPAASTPKK